MYVFFNWLVVVLYCKLPVWKQIPASKIFTTGYAPAPGTGVD